jgi:hypothetical protein
VAHSHETTKTNRISHESTKPRNSNNEIFVFSRFRGNEVFRVFVAGGVQPRNHETGVGIFVFSRFRGNEVFRVFVACFAGQPRKHEAKGSSHESPKPRNSSNGIFVFSRFRGNEVFRVFVADQNGSRSDPWPGTRDTNPQMMTSN